MRCTIPEHKHTTECLTESAQAESLPDEIIESEEADPVRTIRSEPANNGAVADISGNLPENAVAVITDVEMSEDELNMYFGEEMASKMRAFVAYDIKVLVDGEEWQPDDSVTVSVINPDIDVPTDELAVAHIKSDDNSSEIYL